MMVEAPISCDACHNAFCSELSQAAKKDIFLSKSWFDYAEKSEQLFFFDNNQILIIETGCFMTVRHNRQGKQQGVDILESGDLLGIVNLCNVKRHDAISILPFSHICGCMLPIPVFQSLCARHNDIAVAMIAQMSNRFNRLIGHITNQAFGSSAEKIRYSLELSRRHLGNFYLTHEQIALLAGLNRVTVTKLMSEALR